MSGTEIFRFFHARIPVPAMPELESKFFVSVPLTPYNESTLKGGREDVDTPFETQSFQDLVDENDRRKVPGKSHFLKESFF